MKFAIIAAGKGSRMASEGEMLPKPLVKIGGEPMIKRLIDSFMRCGATAISIIINEEMDEVREYLNSLELPIPLDVIVKSTEGSLLSFYEISDRLKDDKFCLSTVDSVFDEEEFEGYIEKFKSDSDVDGYMAVTSFIDDEIPLYIDVDESNLITKFSDEPWEGVRIISGGIYALSAKAELVSQCSKIAGTQKGCAVCQLDMPVKYHNTSRECISLEDVSDMAKVILQLLK